MPRRHLYVNAQQCFQFTHKMRQPNSSHCLQALLAQLVLVGFLFLVAHISPYTKRVDNYLAMFSLVGALLAPHVTCRCQ